MKLVTPFDKDGNKCGVNGTKTEGFPLNYFPGLALLNATSYCIDKCPMNGTSPNNSDGETLAPTIFDTENDLISTYCLPPLDEQFMDLINKVLASLSDQPGFGKYIADLEYSWQPIVYMSLASIVITFVYIWLLKCLTRPLLYISIFIILAALIGLGYWVYTLKDDVVED